MDPLKIIAGVGVSVLSLFGAHMGHVATTTSTTATTTPSHHQINVTCIGAAVNTRETALDTAVSSYTSTINAAYSTRASVLSAAYALTTGIDAIRSAEHAAWSGFASSTESAHQAYRAASTAAWSQFGTAVKSCGGNAPAESDSANAVTNPGI